MNRAIHFCTRQPEFTDVNMLLENRWELDPVFGRPIALENGVVYHLIRYDPEEERPKPEVKPEKPLGVAAEGCELVEAKDVTAKLKEGWLIYVEPTSSSKQVWMIKPRPRVEPPLDDIEKGVTP